MTDAVPQLPPPIQRAVLSLTEMSPSDFDALAAAIASTPPTLPVTAFSSRVAKQSGLPAESVEAIVTTVLLLIAWKEDGSRSTDDVLNGVQGDFEVILANASPVVAKSWATLSARLITLLNDPSSLLIVVKSGKLQTEHQRVLAQARVITDIRPIFADNLEDMIAASLITHELHLTIREGARERDVYVALAAGDLDKLRKAVNRAEVKDRALRAMLRSSGIRVVEEGDE